MSDDTPDSEAPPYAETEKLLMAALDTTEKTGDKSGSSTSHFDLANMYTNNQVYDKAERHFRDGMAMMNELVEADDPKLVEGLNGYASLCSCKKNFARARSILRRIAAIKELELGPGHGEVDALRAQVMMIQGSKDRLLESA